MNESLIGEEVTLTAPSFEGMAGLIAATADAMIEAGGGELDDRGSLQSRLEEALGAVDGADGLTARLTLQSDGLVIRLHRADDEEPHATVHCGA